MGMASWIKPSYTRRLFMWLLAYSFLLVGCFVVFQYHREKEFKTAELNARLQGINSEVLGTLREGTPPVLPRHPFSDLRLTVIDREGRVMYDNALDENATTNHLGREEIRRALESGSGYTVRRHSESTGSTYFYSATLGDNGYVVRTAVPYSVTLSTLLEADMGFIWIMGGITILFCMLGFFVTRRLGQNILRLNDFAERAERGERIYDTAAFSNDELGAISNHIVRLYAGLQQATSERDKEHAAALYQQQEKERIKKQLTNNINHELKTPVASIQVCLELLMNQKSLSEEKRDEFLQRCMTNTVRLKSLLDDVSLITRMDDAPGSIAKERLDLNAVIGEVVTDSEPMALAAGVKIANGVDRPLWLIGNRFLLMSVFRNLIVNALAYSCGTEITIELRSVGPEKAVIVLWDNGVGVPEEHLPHLFERFYRIDKGRSRAAGGTGLGLAIVKNAVGLHGGNIAVDNCPSGGLRYTISFPVDRGNADAAGLDS